MMEVREDRNALLRRLPLLKTGFVASLVVIASSYWLVQVVQGAYFRELAENNRLRKEPVKAPRGLIFDRHGRLLVDNVPSYELYIDRGRSADLEASLEFAAGILEQPVAELAERLATGPHAASFAPVLLAEDLSLTEVARFSIATLEHPEFEIEVGHLRLYRHGPMTAHVLGYLGEATEEELAAPERRFKAGDLIGREGVEKAFDEQLRGVDGQQEVVVDSRGRPRGEFRSTRAVPGQDLELTLDLGLQQLAARYFEERVGAAVALDPRSGEVRVLVSAPSYNPNLFARRLDRGEWQALLAAPHDPLQDRALQNTYSPGSVFKIVLALAGLDTGLATESDSVYCSGSTRIYNRRFRCWKRGGHGRVRLEDALRESCDVYFYHLGQKLGIERIAEYARRFGLGARTGIELGGERAGLVPDLDWSEAVRGTKWYPGETISVAIGQGPLLVTPLQTAALMAAVANGGRLVEPHLVRREQAPAERDLGIDAGALATVRRALWAVVNERGTGAAARVAGVAVAGKTGTAQVVEQKVWTDSRELPFEKRDHAWFGAFAPLEAPELAVVVFVEHGGHGSEQAAPLARILYEKYFHQDRDPRQPS